MVAELLATNGDDGEIMSGRVVTTMRHDKKKGDDVIYLDEDGASHHFCSSVSCVVFVSGGRDGWRGGGGFRSTKTLGGVKCKPYLYFCEKCLLAQ